ncbi:hypothetical protein TNIN_459891 [Trichonephila inaurata madagascariensis]|uniref:Uncharacterized protein n=1 Tax=Trichonephila inaurata madagascariensis TaxID=2747483 RepID=A0A8X6YHI6_9ARAC|nr:hypothetical protein TNIN_459891 [Trichonephila inaurata madagascariensis]
MECYLTDFIYSIYSSLYPCLSSLTLATGVTKALYLKGNETKGLISQRKRIRRNDIMRERRQEIMLVHLFQSTDLEVFRFEDHEIRDFRYRVLYLARTLSMAM